MDMLNALTWGSGTSASPDHLSGRGIGKQTEEARASDPEVQGEV